MTGDLIMLGGWLMGAGCALLAVGIAGVLADGEQQIAAGHKL